MKKILLILSIILFTPSLINGNTALEEIENYDIYDDTLIENIDNYDENIPVIIHSNNQNNINKTLDKYANITQNYTNIDTLTPINISIENITKLSQIEEIDNIYYDEIYTTQVHRGSNQIGVLAGKNTFPYTGKGVSISILDSGVSTTHPDLDIKKHIDFTGDGIGDIEGHGTHVAGIIGATGKSTNNIIQGVAHNADLYDVKVLNDIGEGRASQTIKGIDYSIENNIDIISMSIGSQSPCETFSPTSRAIRKANSMGSLVVVSAGNIGPNSSSATNPGCTQEALTVGAVDNRDNIAPFSSRGPTYTGIFKPDIVAPGVNILSTNINGEYSYKSGTSMAAPFVTGVAALLLEADNTLTPDKIKTILKKTALDLGKDINEQGYGRVDYLKALEKLKSDETIKINSSISPNDIREFLRNQQYIPITLIKKVDYENKNYEYKYLAIDKYTNKPLKLHIDTNGVIFEEDIFVGENIFTLIKTLIYPHGIFFEMIK